MKKKVHLVAVTNLSKSLSVFEDILLPLLVKGHLPDSGFLRTSRERLRGAQRGWTRGPLCHEHAQSRDVDFTVTVPL